LPSLKQTYKRLQKGLFAKHPGQDGLPVPQPLLREAIEQRRDIPALHDRTGLSLAALTRLLAVRDWDSGAVLNAVHATL
jgi:hypothetical protein